MHPYVHCSIVYNSQNMEATQVPINRGLNKEDVVQIYYGILLNHEKNEILTPATTRVNIKDVLLSEISQTQKDGYHMISLICGI